MFPSKKRARRTLSSKNEKPIVKPVLSTVKPENSSSSESTEPPSTENNEPTVSLTFVLAAIRQFHIKKEHMRDQLSDLQLELEHLQLADVVSSFLSSLHSSNCTTEEFLRSIHQARQTLYEHDREAIVFPRVDGKFMMTYASVLSALGALKIRNGVQHEFEVQMRKQFADKEDTLNRLFSLIRNTSALVNIDECERLIQIAFRNLFV